MENDIKPMNILDNGTGSRMCELYSGIRDTGSDLKRIWKQTEEKMLLSEGCGFVNDGTEAHMTLLNPSGTSNHRGLRVKGRVRIGSFVSGDLDKTLTSSFSGAGAAFFAVFAGVMYDESVTHRDETTMSGMVVPVTEIVREPVFNLVLKEVENVSHSTSDGYSGMLIPPKTTAFLSSSEDREMILHRTVSGNNVYIADTEGYENQFPGEGRIRTGACCCLGCFMVTRTSAEFVALRHENSFISGFENETFLGKSVRTGTDIGSDSADRNAVYAPCLKCLDVPPGKTEISDYGVHVMMGDVTDGAKIAKNGVDIQKTISGATTIASMSSQYIGFSDVSDDHYQVFNVGPESITYSYEDYLSGREEYFYISSGEFYIGELFSGQYSSDSYYGGHFGTINFEKMGAQENTYIDGNLSVTGKLTCTGGLEGNIESESVSADVVHTEKVCDSGNNVMGGFRLDAAGRHFESHIGTISLICVVQDPTSATGTVQKHVGDTFRNGEQNYLLSNVKMSSSGAFSEADRQESGTWQSLVDFELGLATYSGRSILRGYMLAIRIE